MHGSIRVQLHTPSRRSGSARDQQTATNSHAREVHTQGGSPHARGVQTRARNRRAAPCSGVLRWRVAWRWGLGPARRGRTRANAPGRRARPAGGAASDARLPKLCVSCTGNRAPDDDQEGHNGRLCRGWEIQEVVGHSSDSRDGVGRDEHDGGGHAGGGIETDAAETTNEAAETATTNSACDAGQRQR